jgi:hypothetical protein
MTTTLINILDYVTYGDFILSGILAFSMVAGNLIPALRKRMLKGMYKDDPDDPGSKYYLN